MACGIAFWVKLKLETKKLKRLKAVKELKQGNKAAGSRRPATLHCLFPLWPVCVRVLSHKGAY